MSKRVTEGHDPDYKTDVYIAMFDIYLKHLKIKQKNRQHSMEEAYDELATYYKNNPDSVELDLLHLSWNEIIPMSDFIHITPRIRESAWKGYTDHDCMKLAQRYHYMLLTKLSKEWDEPSYSQKEETFRAYEDMVDEIQKGYISEEKFKFLESLPEIDNWDHDVAYSMTYESPFFTDKRKYIDHEDIDQMIQRYIHDGFKKDNRWEAKGNINRIRQLMRGDDGSEDKFKTWIVEKLRENQIENVTGETE